MMYDAASDRVIAIDSGASGMENWVYDFNDNMWKEMAKPPIGRDWGILSMDYTYDSESDRVILFDWGGTYVENVFTLVGPETWSYDHSAGAWGKMNPPSAPSVNFYGSMTYDSESDRVVFVGLYSSTSGRYSSLETWAYDYNANMWTSLNPASSPPAREAHAVAYDAKSDRVILFGGYSVEWWEWLADTWAYDYNTNTWTNMTPSSGPSARPDHAMAYDSESDRVILFGGTSPEGWYGDTWAYDFDTNTWTNLTSSFGPAARGRHGLAYDSESDRVILFGGWDYQPDTWAYDYNANTWTAMIRLPRGNLMAYDSRADRVLAVGYHETWAYDTNSDTWEMRRPSLPFWGSSSLAYDSESDRSILLETRYEATTFVETWAYDYNTNMWTNMTPASGPPFLYEPAMVYDAQSDRVILSGSPASGVSYGTPPALSETWAYDYNTNTWTNMTQPVAPSGRVTAAMAYDSQSDRVILFGGGTAVSYCSFGAVGDTWAYDYDSNTWTNMSPPSGPSTRLGHAMTYASDADRVILFGGGPSCVASSNETWTYDFETNTWTNLSLASSPSARTYHRMVFDAESHLTVLYGGWPGSPGPWWLSFSPSPSSPKNLRAVAGNHRVTLTWEAPLFDGGRTITGYRIYRFTWPTGLSIVATVELVLSYTDTGLTNGVLYYYWVSAINAIGEGTLSAAAAATPRLMVSAPSDLHATSWNGEVVLTWQAATSSDDSPITGYRIYRGTSGTYLSVAATLSPMTAYTDANVTNGVTYYYRVGAMSGLDEGPRSNEAVATPREAVKPSIAILSPIDRSTLTSSSVMVSGSASDDTAILKVELSRDGTDWIEASGTASWSGTLFLVEGANTVFARATDTSGNSAITSISVTVATGPTLVEMLTSPVVIGAYLAAVVIAVGAFVVRKRRSKS